MVSDENGLTVWQRIKLFTGITLEPADPENLGDDKDVDIALLDFRQKVSTRLAPSPQSLGIGVLALARHDRSLSVRDQRSDGLELSDGGLFPEGSPVGVAFQTGQMAGHKTVAEARRTNTIACG